jgi:osmoprotectant transport system permease protein
VTALLAQIQFRERKGETCEAKNGFCPDWIADNFDRYIDPFWQHVFLTVTSVAIGFVLAFALALLAHRKRWLIPPRCSSCCCRSPAAATPPL